MRAKVTSIELGGAANLAVLAPIKAGFIEGFETVTYLERLRRLLDAMHSSRQNLREAELQPTVFPDSVGRFGIIHSFRYAIVPPFPASTTIETPGTYRLSLNVTFDGGWEPYMRVIYRDIGTLLDALFCHCDGYPGSRSASYDAYCRWVRNHEIGAGIFYTDAAPVTLSDQHYLAEVERLQRETFDPANPDAVDQAIAAYALDTELQLVARAMKAAAADLQRSLALPIRNLIGLYRLSSYFPKNAAGDDRVLIRFAQSALKEFLELVAELSRRQVPQWLPFERALAEQLGWLAAADPTPPPLKRLDYSPGALQAMVLARDDPVTHGCVAMLALPRSDAPAATHAAARATLAALAARCGAPADARAVRVHLAFTYAGLAAAGVPPDELDLLPQEFTEGMEERSGLLGDVRSNHPDHWSRPLRYRPNEVGERIDLSSVHVVVVMRLIDPGANPADLHPTLAAEVDALAAAGSGVVVLAVQETHSNRDPATQLTREHFGFVDGLSQPVVLAPGQAKSSADQVSPGELVFGYANDRGDNPYPPQANALLDNGSFLVMRKLRQRVDNLNKVLPASPVLADALRAKMMGRTLDGVPLENSALAPGDNGFDFTADPTGQRCPFHSHIRRTNPRDGRAHQPRILRRGMSYGPRGGAAESERGIVFMAYCASIAEQFEIVQRWVSGGNSSGVSSAQADPFLAVPTPGERRTFRYVDAAGKVARADLGDQPFVTLEWGLYLFAPSLHGLRTFAQVRRPTAAPPPAAPSVPPLTERERWRRRLEDADITQAALKDAWWARVRAQRGGRKPARGYGMLVGSRQGVLKVLKDPGTRYSVAGYGQRMSASVGLNHLGMDPGPERDPLAHDVNQIIQNMTEAQAFEVALPFVRAVLAEFNVFRQDDPSGQVRIPVDLISLSEGVLAMLCAEWIGLPETPSAQPPWMVAGGRIDGAGAPARCPGHLLTASRFTFAPHPRPQVLSDGPTQGQAVLQAVRDLLASGQPLKSMSLEIQQKLQYVDASKRDDVIARSISGLLLGFPPTVHGNFLKTLETWIDDKILWACQQRLAEVPTQVDSAYQRARQALREPLLKTMRGRPVPEMLWRCPVVEGKPVFADDQHVVLGIASALADAGDADSELIFGGSRDPASPLHTLHACPGYGMGVGVLLALLSGLLDAGTLRPTGSPVLLMLTPR